MLLTPRRLSGLELARTSADPKPPHPAPVPGPAGVWAGEPGGRGYRGLLRPCLRPSRRLLGALRARPLGGCRRRGHRGPQVTSLSLPFPHVWVQTGPSGAPEGLRVLFWPSRQPRLRSPEPGAQWALRAHLALKANPPLFRRPGPQRRAPCAERPRFTSLSAPRGRAPVRPLPHAHGILALSQGGLPASGGAGWAPLLGRARPRPRAPDRGRQVPAGGSGCALCHTRSPPGPTACRSGLRVPHASLCGIPR